MDNMLPGGIQRAAVVLLPLEVSTDLRLDLSDDLHRCNAWGASLPEHQ